jgi:hypothetical protein
VHTSASKATDMVFISDLPLESEGSNPIKAEPDRFSPAHPLVHRNGISEAFGSFHLDRSSAPGTAARCARRCCDGSLPTIGGLIPDTRNGTRAVPASPYIQC